MTVAERPPPSANALPDLHPFLQPDGRRPISLLTERPTRPCGTRTCGGPWRAGPPRRSQRGSTDNIPIHRSADELPDEVDEAVAEVPTAAVVDVVRDGAGRGIRHLLG